MADVGSCGRATGWRVLVVGVVLVVWAAGVFVGVGAPRAAAASAGSVPVLEAQEVRTVWTNELGVAHPAGLAYDPARREFLVAGDEAGATPVLRLGPDEQRRGAFTLPELSDPQTLAFDAAQGELTAVDGGEQVQVSGAALDARRPAAERVAIDGLQLEAPQSATFDPQTDSWLVLEEGADSVAVVAGQDGGGAAEQVPLAPSDADRLIAFNATDDLLYVMDPDRDRVDAVDLDGAVQKRFSVASTELSAPVAMTFAPSTDPTDDPGDVNLYVADAGGASTFGGVTEVSLAAVVAPAAPVDTATLVRTVQTSSWSPASPDPSGIVWMPASDELVVADSEVDETTGAGWNNVNLWRSTRTGSVVGTGATYGPNAPSNYSREPTGLGYDAATKTLFVSDDDKRKIFVVKRGADGVHGTRDDVVTAIDISPFGNVDTEDPEFDPVSGHLFYLDGVGREIYRINPVDGVFGNGNDSVTHFDISHLGPTDFEGMTSNAERRTLYVGARTTKQIFEVTHDGTLVRTISAPVSAMKYISGLAVAPASNGSGQMNLWIVDRAIDNGPDPTENDGKIFEITAPDIGGAPVDPPPAPAPAPKIEFYRIVYNPPGKDTRKNAHLNKEMIVLHNFGGKGRKISNWIVRDRAGNRYKIPQGFRLRAGGYVRIHTGRGTNDSNDLFWNRRRYVWNNGGDRATLKKASGVVRDRCSYPGGGTKIRC